MTVLKCGRTGILRTTGPPRTWVVFNFDDISRRRPLQSIVLARSVERISGHLPPANAGATANVNTLNRKRASFHAASRVDRCMIRMCP